MWLTIVLERDLLPASNLKIRLNTPSPGFAFQQRECTTSRRESLQKNFYSTRVMFLPRMLSRFCFPAGFLPGSRKRVFSWRDPGEYRFLGGNFSRKGSSRENGPPRRDTGGIPVSAGNLGGIPVPILQG